MGGGFLTGIITKKPAIIGQAIIGSALPWDAFVRLSSATSEEVWPSHHRPGLRDAVISWPSSAKPPTPFASSAAHSSASKGWACIAACAVGSARRNGGGGITLTRKYACT